MVGFTDLLVGAAPMLLLFAAVYVLPVVVAYRRWHAGRTVILLWTVCLGWTGVVWVVAMVWAVFGARQPGAPGSREERVWRRQQRGGRLV